MDREEFIQSLYDYSEEELQGTYENQKKNETEILNNIAIILLTYNIVNSVLKLKRKDNIDNYSKLSKIVIEMFDVESKKTTKIITNVLSEVSKKVFNSYGIKSHKDEVVKIINNHYRGLHFSDRVWDNENKVSKMMHREIKDFLDGKVNVNQIKSHIEKQFAANKYNVERLVETEIARIESQITEKYFKDYGIKKVRYNACLCNTCEKCLGDHDRVFDINDKSRPRLPQHPKCQCFYVQEG